MSLTQASMAQADEVKMISAWAAILFAPTLVGAAYGTNFDHMPELRWILGYPFALALMLVVSVSLYLAFKRRGWSQRSPEEPHSPRCVGRQFGSSRARAKQGRPCSKEG